MIQIFGISDYGSQVTYVQLCVCVCPEEIEWKRIKKYEMMGDIGKWVSSALVVKKKRGGQN